MLAQDPLNLRLFRLGPGEEWIHGGQELAFVFPKGGVGKCVAGTVTHRLAPGEVLVLDATSNATLSVSDEGQMIFWCFSLRLEHLFPLFASNEISLLQNVTDGFKGVKLYPAASPVAKECHRLLAEAPAEFNLDHRSHLLRVAAAILTVEFSTAHTQRVGFVRAEDHLIQVFEKLSTAELLGLSVCDLAAKFGCSRRHLSRLFHHHFGVSVAALRMEMRLLKAVSLLRDPDAKVIRVAEDCGFNHLGLFNTCFKRRFGASPGQWRKLSMQSEIKPGGPSRPDATCPLRVNGLCPWSGKSDDCDPPSPQSVVRTLKASSTRPSTGVKELKANVRRPEAAAQPETRVARAATKRARPRP